MHNRIAFNLDKIEQILYQEAKEVANEIKRIPGQREV